MGNSPSRGAQTGAVISAEALSPLPRYSDIHCVLGGINRQEHMIMKTSIGFGSQKFTLKDCKSAEGKVLLKSESKSSRKRTVTSISTPQGQEILSIQGTHELVAFRKGSGASSGSSPMSRFGGSSSSSGGGGGSLDSNPVAAILPQDYQNQRRQQQQQYASQPLSASSSDGVSSIGSSGAGNVYSSSAASDLAFAARALDATFFDWGIEVKNLAGLSGLSGNHPAVTLWTQENPAMGTVDFSWEGQVVARIATSVGGSILWRGEKYDVGKNNVAIVVAPGMDWILVATLCFLFLNRKSDHEAGVSIRAGDLNLLSSLFEGSTGGDANRSTSSIGTRSSGEQKSLKGGQQRRGILRHTGIAEEEEDDRIGLVR